MNKKGLSIIELLAVIVLIAVVGIVCIPIFIGVIQQSRLNSLRDSAYGLIKSSNLYYAQYQNSTNIRFDIEGKVATSSDTTNPFKFKGNIKEGVVIIKSNGKNVICVTDGKNSAYKNDNESKVNLVSGQKCTIPDNSSIVYLDGEATADSYELSDLVEAIDELKAEIASLKTELKMEIASQATGIKNNDNTNTAAIINSINRIIASSGGLPTLDYANPLHKFASQGLTYTATQECYLTGRITGGGNKVFINDNEFYAGTNGYNWDSTNDNIPLIRLSAGDVVRLSNAQNVYVLARK